MVTPPVIPEPHLGGYIHGSDPNTWYPALWTWLRNEYDVSRVLDVGCGEGYTARFWRTLGCQVCGLEGSPDAVRDSVIPESVHLHDFRHGPFNVERFDLAWCCEVVEHIDAEYVPHVLDTFASARLIVMTHGVPGQSGHHHVNCQPSTYWARQLGSRGYYLDYVATRRARHLAHAYFCTSGMVFTRAPRWLPSVVAVHLLNIEWFPRRVWRHLRQQGVASLWRTFRK